MANFATKVGTAALAAVTATLALAAPALAVSAPTTVDDALTTYRSAGATGTVNVLRNDSCDQANGACPLTLVDVSIVGTPMGYAPFLVNRPVVLPTEAPAIAVGNGNVTVTWPALGANEAPSTVRTATVRYVVRDVNGETATGVLNLTDAAVPPTAIPTAAADVLTSTAYSMPENPPAYDLTSGVDILTNDTFPVIYNYLNEGYTAPGVAPGTYVKIIEQPTNGVTVTAGPDPTSHTGLLYLTLPVLPDSAFRPKAGDAYLYSEVTTTRFAYELCDAAGCSAPATVTTPFSEVRNPSAFVPARAGASVTVESPGAGQVTINPRAFAGDIDRPAGISVSTGVNATVEGNNVASEGPTLSIPGDATFDCTWLNGRAGEKNADGTWTFSWTDPSSTQDDIRCTAFDPSKTPDPLWGQVVANEFVSITWAVPPPVLSLHPDDVWVATGQTVDAEVLANDSVTFASGAPQTLTGRFDATKTAAGAKLGTASFGRDGNRLHYVASQTVGLDNVQVAVCVQDTCDTETVTVHVSPNDQANPDAVTVDPGVSAAVVPLGNDVFTDTPVRTAEITLGMLPPGVSAVVNADRTVTVTADQALEGSTVSVPYVLRDFTGTSASRIDVKVSAPAAPTPTPVPTTTPPPLPPVVPPVVPPTPHKVPTPHHKPAPKPTPGKLHWPTGFAVPDHPAVVNEALLLDGAGTMVVAAGILLGSLRRRKGAHRLQRGALR